MAETKSWYEYCRCVGLIVFTLLILGGLIMIFMCLPDGHGGTANAQDYAVCNAINEKQPFMMPIKNVSLLQGSAVQVDCNVVRQGFIAANQKIFWKGPIFQAGDQIGLSTFTKIFQSQKGVNVTASSSREGFSCGDPTTFGGIKVALMQNFTLIFDPVNIEHEGWYTCTSNVTQITTDDSGQVVDGTTYFLEERFYLSVVDSNKI